MKRNSSLDWAKKLDGQDPLARMRNQFIINDPTLIYLDGNSLGKLPKATIDKLETVVQNQWGTDLINSWNLDWYRKSEKLGNKIAKIIGAENGEVIVSDNTSINLYKLAHAALKYQKGRKSIVTDTFNFPSDVYIIQGLVKEINDGHVVDYLASADGISINDDDIASKITSNTSLVTLSHVAFKSAYMYDIEYVTKTAHGQGALTLWDLSHSVGVVPMDVKKCNVDLAVGCTYKYLNGGPGAPAFLYIRKDLQEKLSSPIQGWFGVKNPFEFNLDYQAAHGIHRFLSGTPPILSLSAIEPGLDLVIDVGVENIRRKSIRLSSFFTDQFNSELVDLGFELASPMEEEKRGSHISIKHNEAFRIIKALMDKSIDGHQIIPDFRAPDNIRFGFAPLYNSFLEVDITIQKLKKIVKFKLYQNYDNTRTVVT